MLKAVAPTDLWIGHAFSELQVLIITQMYSPDLFCSMTYYKDTLQMFNSLLSVQHTQKSIILLMVYIEIGQYSLKAFISGSFGEDQIQANVKG